MDLNTYYATIHRAVISASTLQKSTHGAAYLRAIREANCHASRLTPAEKVEAARVLKAMAMAPASVEEALHHWRAKD